MSKYEVQWDDNNAICPYCGYGYHVEAEDYSEDNREEECENCGKKYWLTQSFSISHRTTPDCGINGEAHQYERVTLKNGKIADFCHVCDNCRIPD